MNGYRTAAPLRTVADDPHVLTWSNHYVCVDSSSTGSSSTGSSSAGADSLCRVADSMEAELAAETAARQLELEAALLDAAIEEAHKHH